MKIINIFFLAILLFFGCSQLQSSQNEKNETVKVLLSAEQYLNKKCIDYSFNNSKLSVARYDNYQGFVNDKLYDRLGNLNGDRYYKITTLKKTDQRYNWLKTKNFNNPFWHIVFSSKYTNISFTKLLKEKELFIDAKTFRVIESPFTKGNHCNSKATNPKYPKVLDLYSLGSESKIIEYLNGKNFKDINKSLKPFNITLLSEAIWKNYSGLSQFLIKKGHSITFSNLKNAIGGGLEKTAALILKKKTFTSSEYVKLIEFSDTNYQKKVSHLIEKSINEQEFKQKWMLFFKAIRGNNYSVVEDFLKNQDFGIQYKFEPYSNSTPLEISLNSFNFDMIIFLIKSGAGFFDSEEDQLKWLEILSLDNPQKTFELVSFLKKMNLLKANYLYDEFREGSGALTSEQNP